jgi:hypothetical protein
MNKSVIPIVSVVNYVPKYSQTISIVQYRLAQLIENDFIESCIIKLVPKYRNQLNMIYKLIGLIEQPDVPQINLDDLIQWDLNHILNLREPLSYIRFKGLGLFAFEITSIINWVEAIYSGIHLLRLEMRLKVSQSTEANVLQTLADLSATNYISDNESLDSLSETESIDYLII